MDRTESENLKAEQQKLPNLNNKQNEIIEGAGEGRISGIYRAILKGLVFMSLKF